MTEELQYPLPYHHTVHVDLGPRAYDILIGYGLLPYLERFIVERGNISVESQDVLISDQHILTLDWTADIRCGWHSWVFPPQGVAPGEQYKSMTTVSEILSYL